MSKLIIKIDKNYKSEINSEKWLIVELEEAIQYGSSFYSKIKVEFNSEEEIKDFQAGKKLDLKIPDDKTKGEGNVLTVPHPWTAELSVGQKITDTTRTTGRKISEASKKATKKTASGIKNVGESLDQASDKLPSWVLPVGIVVGALLLAGVLYWVFKKK